MITAEAIDLFPAHVRIDGGKSDTPVRQVAMSLHSLRRRWRRETVAMVWLGCPSMRSSFRREPAGQPQGERPGLANRSLDHGCPESHSR